jgi:hypothetical protein
MVNVLQHDNKKLGKLCNYAEQVSKQTVKTNQSRVNLNKGKKLKTSTNFDFENRVRIHAAVLKFNKVTDGTT